MRGFMILALIPFVSGCGGNDYPSASVKGKVTLDGQPMEGVIVRFQPVGEGTMDTSKMNVGMASYGETDKNGEFTLRFSDNSGSGAMLGEHVVVIDERTPEEEEDNDAGGINEPPKKSRIPPKWADGSQRFVVKEEGNEPHFELSE